MTVNNAQARVATDEPIIAAPGIRWLSAPGAFRLASTVVAQTEALRWIPPSSRVSVAGISIPGGIYVGTCRYYAFTFVIDPTLPVGRPEKAEPIVPSRYATAYSHLSDNQRAYYLRWLCGDTQGLQHVDSSPYLRRFLSGLEWRLCVQRDTDDTFLDACELLAFRDGRQFQYHALELLSWWGQLQGAKAQMIVLQEAIKWGFTKFSDTSLRLALANYASAGAALPVEIAAEIGLYHTRQRVHSVPNLGDRLRRRLLSMYPQGIHLPPTKKRVVVSYSPVCPEFQNECLVRQGSPIPRLEIPDFTPEISGSVDQVLSSIIHGPYFDPVVAASVASETRSTQAVLEREFPTPAEEIHPVTLPCSNAPLDLSDNYKAALGRILTRQTWSKADFAKLAQEFRLMPSGLRIHLNRWAEEKFGDLLLDGTEPIQLNPYVIDEIERYV